MKKILIMLSIILTLILPISAMAFEYTVDENTGIKLYELPNGVKDEIVDGKLIKRVSNFYIPSASDIVHFVKKANVDLVVIQLPKDCTTENLVQGRIFVLNIPCEPISHIRADDVSYIGKCVGFQSIARQFGIVVTKNQYESVIDVRNSFLNDYNLNQLIYQLETPEVHNLGPIIGKNKVSIIINELRIHIKNIAIAISKTITEFFYDGEAITARGYLFFAYVVTVFCLSVLAIVFKRR